MTTYNVYAGQVSSGLDVDAFDRLNVYQGGTAVGATNGGTSYVYAGGVEAGEYDSGGTDIVYSGGAVENATVDFLGREYLSSGSLDEGGEVLFGDIYAFSGATIQGVTFSTGTGGVGDLQVYAGAKLDNVMFAGGEEDLLSGVVMSGVTVSGAGLAYLELGSGSEAVSASVQYNGQLLQFPGALSVDTTVGVGGILALFGGTESGAQVAGGGEEVIEQNGVSFGGDTISSGGVLKFVGETFSGASNLAIGAVSANTTAFNDTLQAGAIVSGFVNTFEAGATETISSGYTADSDNIESGGVATVLSGATISGAGVASGGSVVLYGGASLNNVTFFGGAEVIVAGYDVSNISVQAGVVAALIVSSGAVADDVTVSSGGALSVCNLGAADNVSVSSGGVMVLSQGGQDSNVAVFSGGTLTVSSGGTDTGTTVSGGQELILAGGVANDLTLIKGGAVVDSGTLTNAATDKITGALSGNGLIVQTSGGTLGFAGVDSAFTGQVFISAGTVEFQSAFAPSGSIAFEGGTAATTLRLYAPNTPASGASFADPLVDFDSSTKRLDLTATPYVSGATATISGHVLTLHDGAYTASFTLSGMGAASYSVAADGSGTVIAAAAGAKVAPLVHAMVTFNADGSPAGATSAYELDEARTAPLAVRTGAGRSAIPL